MTTDYQFDIHCPAESIPALRSEVETFGFAFLENALGDDLFRALHAEAMAQRIGADDVSDDGVGATAPYKARRAHLGTVARSFLASDAIRTLLGALLSEDFALTDDASCYTYYDALDFMAAHRDRPDDCVATVIVYLSAASPDPRSPHTGLSLRLLGEGTKKTSKPTAVIPTRSRSIVVGRGSRTWHDRPPLQDGESVVALTACFTSAT